MSSDCGGSLEDVSFARTGSTGSGASTDESNNAECVGYWLCWSKFMFFYHLSLSLAHRIGIVPIMTSRRRILRKLAHKQLHHRYHQVREVDFALCLKYSLRSVLFWLAAEGEEEGNNDRTVTITEDPIIAMVSVAVQTQSEMIDLSASPVIEMIDLTTRATIDLCTPDEKNEESTADSSPIHLSKK